MMLKGLIYTCLAVSGTAFNTGSINSRYSTKLFTNNNTEMSKYHDEVHYQNS